MNPEKHTYIQVYVYFKIKEAVKGGTKQNRIIVIMN